MKKLSRTPYLPLFLFSLFLASGSFIFQYLFHWQPCFLCILARIIAILLTMLYGAALLHQPNACGRAIYFTLATTLILAGMAITGRHLWLLHLPAELVPACGPGFNYLIETLPLKEALLALLQSSGECTTHVQYILGVSLPTWTFMSFCGLLMANGWSWCYSKKKG